MRTVLKTNIRSIYVSENGLVTSQRRPETGKHVNTWASCVSLLRPSPRWIMLDGVVTVLYFTEDLVSASCG